MFDLAFHYLNPTGDRSAEFKKTLRKNEEISEAIKSPKIVSNEKIIQFVCLDQREVISHLAWGRLGNKAGTGLRRINLEFLTEINPIPVQDIRTDKDLKDYSSFFSGRDVFKKSEESSGFFSEIREKYAEVDKFISEFEIDYELISELDEHARGIVRQENDAVEMALRVADIMPREAYNWSPTKHGKSEITSFFSGLSSKKLNEDDVVRWDFSKIPGFDKIDEKVFGYCKLSDGIKTLHTFHANKNDLEHTIGVDLIYFNEQHESFVLIQYKMSEPQGATHVFRFPSNQLNLEIDRMDAVLEAIRRECIVTESECLASDFRLTDGPFFLKFCPRDEFDPAKHEQVKGIIIPLKMWKAIENDNSGRFLGPNGGKVLSFDNCPRHFDNTQFISMILNGWVGTTSIERAILERLITEIINSDRSLVVALKLNEERVKIDERKKPSRKKKPARKRK